MALVLDSVGPPPPAPRHHGLSLKDDTVGYAESRPRTALGAHIGRTNITNNGEAQEL
jgi:hypothetical protein